MTGVLLALWVGCVRAEPAATVPPAAPSPAAPSPAAPSPPAAPSETVIHPGTVLFIDPDGSKRETNAQDLPDTIAWYTAPDGARTPCVRVEASRRGTALEIQRFAADGALLATTMSSPRP